MDGSGSGLIKPGSGSAKNPGSIRIRNTGKMTCFLRSGKCSNSARLKEDLAGIKRKDDGRLITCRSEQTVQVIRHTEGHTVH